MAEAIVNGRNYVHFEPRVARRIGELDQLYRAFDPANPEIGENNKYNPHLAHRVRTRFNIPVLSDSTPLEKLVLPPKPINAPPEYQDPYTKNEKTASNTAMRRAMRSGLLLLGHVRAVDTYYLASETLLDTEASVYLKKATEVVDMQIGSLAVIVEFPIKSGYAERELKDEIDMERKRYGQYDPQTPVTDADTSGLSPHLAQILKENIENRRENKLLLEFTGRINGITHTVSNRLKCLVAAGYTTVESVTDLTAEEFAAIPGMSGKGAVFFEAVFATALPQANKG